jgi:hypothetical protein
MLLLWGPIKWPAYAVGEVLACELEYLQEKILVPPFRSIREKIFAFSHLPSF